jgi:hypothetical protein
LGNCGADVVGDDAEHEDELEDEFEDAAKDAKE